MKIKVKATREVTTTSEQVLHEGVGGASFPSVVADYVGGVVHDYLVDEADYGTTDGGTNTFGIIKTIIVDLSERDED